MKLYTEEQVLKIIQKSVMDKPQTYYEVLKDYTPIELPSEIDIEEEAFIIPYNNSDKFYDESFIKGAKWVKEQIINQNK